MKQKRKIKELLKKYDIVAESQKEVDKFREEKGRDPTIREQQLIAERTWKRLKEKE